MGAIVNAVELITAFGIVILVVTHPVSIQRIVSRIVEVITQTIAIAHE